MLGHEVADQATKSQEVGGYWVNKTKDFLKVYISFRGWIQIL